MRNGSPLGPAAIAEPGAGKLWDAHGPWEYGDARQPGPQYARINAVRPLLHSELGAPGEASAAAQRRALTAARRSRSPANSARRHHGGAWWEHRATVERLFGPLADESLAVLTSQWLQAEALRYFVEETRRRWPDSAGIYPWQLNEPWPNVACTSAVEYGGRPKLAYFAVRGAYRPTLAKARYAGLTTPPGEPLRAAVWLLNDGAEATCNLAVTLHDLAGHALAAPGWYKAQAPSNAGAHLCDLELPLPAGFEGIALLDLALAVDGAPPVRNRYLFSNRAETPLREALAHPDALRAMFPPPARDAAAGG